MKRTQGKKSHKRGSRVQNNDVLQQRAGWKFIVVPCLLVLLGTVGYLFWFNLHNNNVESQVAYIKQYMKNGSFNDWQGKLNCDGIEDIKWYKDNKTTEIDVGRIAMTWENDKFLTKSNLELISQIGFEVKYSKSVGDIKLFWNGQEVEKWVKR